MGLLYNSFTSSHQAACHCSTSRLVNPTEEWALIGGAGSLLAIPHPLSLSFCKDGILFPIASQPKTNHSSCHPELVSRSFSAYAIERKARSNYAFNRAQVGVIP